MNYAVHPLHNGATTTQTCYTAKQIGTLLNHLTAFDSMRQQLKHKAEKRREQ